MSHVECGFAGRRQTLGHLILNYRACGAECREDWLRMLANENGLPFMTVQRLAEELGEREDFGELVHLCECGGGLCNDHWHPFPQRADCPAQ